MLEARRTTQEARATRSRNADIDVVMVVEVVDESVPYTPSLFALGWEPRRVEMKMLSYCALKRLEEQLGEGIVVYLKHLYQSFRMIVAQDIGMKNGIVAGSTVAAKPHCWFEFLLSLSVV